MKSKRVIAGLLASVLLMSNSMNVFANSVGVSDSTGSGNSPTNFIASSAILGGDLIVTVPDDLTLSKSGTNMTGTGTVTAEGNVNPGSVLTVSTDTTITYVNQSDNTITVPATVTFGTDGSVSWTAEELMSNLTADPKLGYDVTATIPMTSIQYIGDYKSNIVFNIAFAAANATTTYYMGYSLSDPATVNYANDTNIKYDIVPQTDQVAELKEFSTDRSVLEGKGYIITESDSANLVIPSVVGADDAEVVGVSFDTFFADDTISNYVNTVNVPSSVTGVELTDSVDSTSSTVISCDNVRTAVDLSKKLPDAASIRFNLDGGVSEKDYAEYFCYKWMDADASIGIDESGWLVCGFSNLGYQKLIEYGADATVTINLPVTNLTSDREVNRVIGFCAYNNDSDAIDVPFENALVDTNMPKMEWIFPETYTYCEGFWGGGCTNEGKQKITGIELNEGLIYIGLQAFKDCDGITSVTIPSTVQTVEREAFYGCDNLTNIMIANGFNGSFGDSSYINTFTAARKITLPSSMTTFNPSALGENGDAQNIRFVNWNVNHDAVSILNDDEAQSTAVKYADGNYVGFGSNAKVARIPSADGTTATVSEDGSTATINANITDSQYKTSSYNGYDVEAYKHIVIANGVTSIADNGLDIHNNNYWNPETITIPDSVTEFGSYAIAVSDSFTTNLGTLDLRNKTFKNTSFQNAKFDKLIVNGNDLYKVGLNDMDCVTVTDLYIINDDSFLWGNIDIYDVKRIHFSGSEAEWTTFLGSKSLSGNFTMIYNSTP